MAQSITSSGLVDVSHPVYIVILTVLSVVSVALIAASIIVTINRHDTSTRRFTEFGRLQSMTSMYTANMLFMSNSGMSACDMQVNDSGINASVVVYNRHELYEPFTLHQELQVDLPSDLYVFTGVAMCHDTLTMLLFYFNTATEATLIHVYTRVAHQSPFSARPSADPIHIPSSALSPIIATTHMSQWDDDSIMCTKANSFESIQGARMTAINLLTVDATTYEGRTSDLFTVPDTFADYFISVGCNVAMDRCWYILVQPSGNTLQVFSAANREVLLTVHGLAADYNAASASDTMCILTASNTISADYPTLKWDFADQIYEPDTRFSVPDETRHALCAVDKMYFTMSETTLAISDPGIPALNIFTFNNAEKCFRLVAASSDNGNCIIVSRRFTNVDDVDDWATENMLYGVVR